MDTYGEKNRSISPEDALRVLRREQDLNFNNTAVIGGLDNFIANASRNLPLIDPPAGWTYRGLHIEKRRSWVQAAIQTLDVVANKSISARRKQTKPNTTRRHPQKSISLDAPIETLPYFPRRFKSHFYRMGIQTVRDALWMAPSRYVDRSKIVQIFSLSYTKERQEVTVEGHIVDIHRSSIGGSPGATIATVSDATGILKIIWFRQPYLAEQLKVGSTLTVSGELSVFKEKVSMINPDYEIISDKGGKSVHTGRIIPVYPSTQGLYQRTIRTVTRLALDSTDGVHREWLPLYILKKYGFQNLQDALDKTHYPPSVQDGEKARKRLAFGELFLNQLSILKRRDEWRSRKGGVPITDATDTVVGFLKSLPFEITADQHAALEEIMSDLAKPVPMSRILQGEVGSGKTVVALAAMLAVSAKGHSAALLSPTEVLAEQHFLSISQQLGAEEEGMIDTLRIAVDEVSGRKIRIGIITGSLSTQKKSFMQHAVTSEVDIIIGTHALLQDKVAISNLGLVVVDEQHRFGVEQRAALADRTPRPHVLAMSATPIPRTLSLTVYGDLEISTLREIPHGRRPIVTKWAWNEETREEAYKLVAGEVTAGRQAFIVCPFIEESEMLEARSAIKEYECMRIRFPDADIGLLHGRMPLREKQAIMNRFRSGKVGILVATPVIEVGIDISNATVMLIESADRFGLAQLHQLRGRVGRGSMKSWCVILTDNVAQESKARLETFVKTVDGFTLSEKDLDLRGPGDYLGTRQTGWPIMKVARYTDKNLLEAARQEVKQILSRDPNLARPEHATLAAEWTAYDKGLRDEAEHS